MDSIYQILVSENGLVRQYGFSSILTEGFIEVSDETYAQIASIPAGRALYSSGTVTEIEAPPEPKSSPANISDRQFFQQLAADEVITQEEALAAVQTGVLPNALELLVMQVPWEQRFAARMLLTGATEFRFDHPLVDTIRAAFGWSSERLAAFWRAASTL